MGLNDKRRLIFLLVLIASAICWPTALNEDTKSLIDTQIAAAAPGNSSNAVGPAPQTVELSKMVTTSLALFAVCFMAFTYWFLNKYTLQLSNDIWLPASCLELQLAAILLKTLSDEDPVTSGPRRPQNHSKPKGKNQTSLPWALSLRITGSSGLKIGSSTTGDDCLIKGHGDSTDDKTNVVQVKNVSVKSPQPRKQLVRLRTSSPVMKTMVQISVWNHVRSSLVIVMIISTVCHNGFLNKTTTDDSVLRLILISVYGAANFFFQYHTSTLLYRNFTSVIFQACWTLVCSTCMFVPGERGNERRSDSEIYTAKEGNSGHSPERNWKTIDLELFGKAKQPTTQRNEPLEFVNTVRDSKIKEYEKSLESSLEKTLANIAVLLGICLATGLASWTSAIKNDSTTAQLGSYALLVSVNTGFLALVRIHSQLTNATEPAGTLLVLQEKTIEAALGDDHDFFIRTFSIREKPQIGLSEGADHEIDKKVRLGSTWIWRLARRWPPILLLYFFLGSAFSLIPWDREYDDKRHMAINVDIKDVNFKFCPRCGCDAADCQRPNASVA